jgi:hypothetical protein
VKILLLALLALASSAPPALAQKRPDFTGTWTEDPSQRKLPAEERQSQGGAALAGEMPPLKITQTADRLTIEERFMSQVTQFVYDFDGRENKTEDQPPTSNYQLPNRLRGSVWEFLGLVVGSW